MRDYSVNLASASNNFFACVISDSKFQSWLRVKYPTADKDVAALKSDRVPGSTEPFASAIQVFMIYNPLYTSRTAQESCTCAGR